MSILYAQHPNCLPRVRKCHQKVPHSQEFTTRSGSSSKITAATASCSAMTIHSHSDGCFYPCDLIRLYRRIVRRRRYVKQQCKHEGSWSPTTLFQRSIAIGALLLACTCLLERGSGLERALRALQGSALGAAAWRAPGGRRRRNEGVVAKSKPRGRMWRSRWCPLRAR